MARYFQSIPAFINRNCDRCQPLCVVQMPIVQVQHRCRTHTVLNMRTLAHFRFLYSKRFWPTEQVLSRNCAFNRRHSKHHRHVFQRRCRMTIVCVHNPQVHKRRSSVCGILIRPIRTDRNSSIKVAKQILSLRTRINPLSESMWTTIQQRTDVQVQILIGMKHDVVTSALLHLNENHCRIVISVSMMSDCKLISKNTGRNALLVIQLPLLSLSLEAPFTHGSR
mmetsp:Transcript_12964/g.23312  ORF Transcript_12964/g.23312 Transcript_12964/m.23312 type:complete len:223 (+) Transcript_12964:683-1351(+)